MVRTLPSPGLSIALFAVWLLLTDSFSAGQLILGIVVAIAVPLVIGARRAQSGLTSRLGVIVRLGLVVGVDVVRSNLELAVRILGPESAVKPTYVWVPLSLEHPAAISILAGIITLTPGTVSADIAPSGRHLLVHAFNAPDPDALVAQVKRRYEAPLEEIFA